MINELTKPDSSSDDDTLQPLGVPVAEAAEILHCSRTKVYELINGEYLRTYDLSNKGCKRVVVSSIHQFVNSGGVNVSSQVPMGVRVARTTVTPARKWG